MTQSLRITDLTVLLVEPSRSQRKLIRRFLAAAGVEKVDEADSIEAAFGHLAGCPADLVLSSLYLPDGTSAELIARMRETEETSRIPLMLLSSEDRWHNLDPVRQAGVVAIVAKPFTAEDLRAALYSALDFLEPPELRLEHYDIEELRVLLVDDSALARRHLSRVLEDMGIRQIVTARDGREAVAELAAGTFDLVVTDYNMPEMDGEALTRYIRGTGEHAHLPVLMVTSEQNGARLATVRQSGVSALCDKPFEPANVRGLLERVLND